MSSVDTCASGHEYEAGVYYLSGARRCRECTRATNRAAKQRLRDRIAADKASTQAATALTVAPTIPAGARYLLRNPSGTVVGGFPRLIDAVAYWSPRGHLDIPTGWKLQKITGLVSV